MKNLYEIAISKKPKQKVYMQNLSYGEAQKIVKRIKRENPTWNCFIWKQF